MPGDLIYIDGVVKGQWPPDGARSFALGSMQHIEPLECKVLDRRCPALLISIEEKYTWFRTIILHEGRLWWIPISKFL